MELKRKMIMKKLLAVSVFVLTVFASVAGPAVADEIGSERGAPGWYGPQQVS
jgi:hypothetical protein